MLNKQNPVRRQLPILGLAFILCLALLTICSGIVGAITRGYQSDDEGLKPGMVVALSQSGATDDQKVERATQDRPQGIIGVAVHPENSLVTTASGDEGIYVETGGEVEAFISDINGEVKKGDLLGLSPLKGVLMGVSSAEPALAIALEDISYDSSETYEVNGETGVRSTRISLGKVNLDQKAVNNLVIARSDSSLERLGRAIVGKDVGEIRVAIALLIFLIVMIAEGGVIYGAVSSAIMSLGRNPLAKSVIKKELVRVLFIAILVLAFGASAIYAVLWI